MSGYLVLIPAKHVDLELNPVQCGLMDGGASARGRRDQHDRRVFVDIFQHRRALALVLQRRIN